MSKEMAQLMTICLLPQIADTTFRVERFGPLKQTFNCIRGNAIGVIAFGKFTKQVVDTVPFITGTRRTKPFVR